MKLSWMFAWFLIAGTAGAVGAQTVAVVGGRMITAADLARRVAIEHAYGNKTVPSAAVLVRLVGEAFEAEAADRAGVAPVPAEVTALREHADATTQAPLVLAAIKALFGGDVPSYESEFLRPKVVSQKVHGAYLAVRAEGGAERATAEAVLAGVLGGATLADAAAAHGATVERREVLRAAFEGMTDPLLAVLDPLAAGQVAPDVVDADDAFMVVQLVERREDVFAVDLAAVPRQAFDSWLAATTAGVSVTIQDAALASAVTSTYGSVWWVQERLVP